MSNSVIDMLLPQEKELSFKYKDNILVEFKYKEPTIETELQISSKQKALANAFGIPLEELDNDDSPYKNEIFIISIISRLLLTVSDIKVNGEELPLSKLAEIKDVEFLLGFFRIITENTENK